MKTNRLFIALVMLLTVLCSWTQCVYADESSDNYISQIDSEYFSVLLPDNQDLVLTEGLEFIHAEAAVFGSFNDAIYEITIGRGQTFTTEFNDLWSVNPNTPMWYYYATGMVIEQISAKLEAKAGVDNLLVESITRTYIGGLPALTTNWYFLMDTFTSGEADQIPMYCTTYIIPNAAFGFYRIEVQSIEADHRQELFDECVSTIRWKQVESTIPSYDHSEVDIYDGFYKEMTKWYLDGKYEEVRDFLQQAEMLGGYRDSSTYYEKSRTATGKPKTYEESFQKATDQFNNGAYESAEYNFRMMQAFHVPQAKEMRMKCLQAMGIHVPDMRESAYNNTPDNSRPSYSDYILKYNPAVSLPDDNEFLDDFEYKYIQSSKGNSSVYCFSNLATGDSVASNYIKVKNGTEVIVVARNRFDFSCVLIPSLETAGWIRNVWLVDG